MGEACELSVHSLYDHTNMQLVDRAIAMGNSGDARYLPVLHHAAAEGSEQVRRFAQIAIKRIEAGGRGKEMNSR